MKKWRILLFFTSLFLIWPLIYPAPPITVIYPAPENDRDVRYADIIEMLITALERTRAIDGDFIAKPCDIAMNESRQLIELKTGKVLNVGWSSASEQKMHDYLPILIPVNKGLIGFRLCLIAKDSQLNLDKVKTIEDLRKLTIGQGHGWGDVAIYRANGINVTEAEYGSLFNMVSIKRFDLFPRGLNEVFSEFEVNKAANPNLAIETGLILYYPWPYYLYVSKSNPELAKRVLIGMRAMVKDGEFDAIFWKYHGEDIKRANLNKRRIITLMNPDLPKNTPLNDKALWFDPSLGN